MNIQALLQKKSVQPYLLKARYGLEKESQRTSLTGELATSDYPSCLGNRTHHPYIQTDFAETQMELITPVTNSIPELFRYLAAIHDVAYRSMDQVEMLWPLSMPPALPEKEEEIVIAKLDNFEGVLYRRYLAKTYGKRKQMVSGIHFNFEFDDALVQQLFNQQTAFTDYLKFKTELYLKVTRNYMHYRWLVTYFYGASPVSEACYFVDEKGPKEPVRSIRSSQYGYTNHEDVKVTYRTLEGYLSDIARMVEEGKLSEDKEYYASVRLRGGKKVADLADAGIRYIELRNIDLNPYEPYGISEEQVAFLHVFLLFLLWKDEGADADAWIAEGERKNNLVALEHPLAVTAFAEEGRQLVAELAAFIEQFDLSVPADMIVHLEQMLAEPTQTLAGKIYTDSQPSQQAFAVEKGRHYHTQAWKKPYQLAGFRGMELSTQILLFDAIQRGIQVEVLDESDQFVKLTAGKHVEYVKNANMTRKDSYIVPLIMENKTVTKKVLKAAGFRVPAGSEFADVQSALQAYPEFAEQGFVVKPKSTNYGLGISIFKEGASYEAYQEAVEIAFSEDSSILVEEFLPGTEYRFFVLDGETRAIMLRVPANVKGDGVHTVAELVAKKNEDPLRGSHHRSPLELIQLGTIEKLMLKEQGYTIDSIPEPETIVYLRENSNISTGGDSIDVTNQIPQGYKDIAVKAVEALGAVICGIDLIIPDTTRSADEPNAYGIIEANFNPAMHMHMYVYQGENRRLTKDVLDLLFPEV
ncbi:bifunctional glutamate--cysteine ligase GshA/glutathione synthetase GshB [Candidatus Enterococcus willemsii]|uniref:Glutathione biosynthesis bifunctional protein GshAB n=1 Tax=Candidatus Enterococcus willemsii TaxID=1857215 RepID=A0ABQ6Z100_9ENTE|nr:bifunctional glutamate--cysteine ligase GshA/glutathione synthetase GshB [Enterococcus sp. CU12B]KAF1304434.1 bifunctional glutamate--cysteine ligase/glutathione synthetase [Enterococcus sp. CU12B]